MDWSLMNPIGLVETDIGFLVNGIYIVSDDCEDTLLEILDLIGSDGIDGPVRHQILQQNLIPKDLIPLLMAIEEDSPFSEYAIKLLSLLTQPLDLLTGPHPPGSPEFKRVSAVIGLLQQADEACWNTQFLIKVIRKEICLRLERAADCPLNPKDCETINYALLLIRNLFYYGERDRQSHFFETRQRMIFESGIDKVLLTILRHPQKILFTVTVVQILSFLFKDHEKYLYRQTPPCSPTKSPLDTDREMVLGVNSDLALISNTPDIHDSMMRREFINSIMDTMELRKPIGDGGGGTSEKEVMLDMLEKENLSHVSDADVIRQYLHSFLKQFLPEIFTSFIADLLKITMSSNGKIFDNSYLIWSLSFFPRFAYNENYFIKDIFRCIDINMISYLVYVVVECTEKLQALQQQKQSCEQTHQKLHLTVLSLLNLFRLMITAVENPELQAMVPLNLQESLAKMSELREVFLLLLRHHQCNKHGMSYLRDVIITNHHLLLLLEKWGVEKLTPPKFSMLDHIKKFATVEVMGKYGHALENFDRNHGSLNDCILTMMHHIAGDCTQPRCLMQLSIMKTFTDIWDQKHLLSEDFNDLIEFVLGQFMNLAEEDPFLSAQMLFGTKENIFDMEAEDASKGEGLSSWSDEEREILMSSILDLTESDNIATDLKQALRQSGIYRTEEEIECYIREMGWLPSDMLMVPDDVSSKQMSTEESKKMEIIEELSNIPQENLLKYLVTRLRELGHEEQLQWLQDNLLQAAEDKLCCMQNSLEKIGEPIRRLCSLLKKDYVIMMVTEEQEKICHNIYFFALLNELELRSPVVSEKQAFWRIPFEWTPTKFLEKAQLLGPLSFDQSKFSEEEDLAYLFTSATSISSDSTDTDDSPQSSMKDVKIPDSEWITCVQQVNKLQAAQLTSISMDVN